MGQLGPWMPGLVSDLWALGGFGVARPCSIRDRVCSKTWFFFASTKNEDRSVLGGSIWGLPVYGNPSMEPEKGFGFRESL